VSIGKSSDVISSTPTVTLIPLYFSPHHGNQKTESFADSLQKNITMNQSAM
jgi:hypothetical protein